MNAQFEAKITSAITQDVTKTNVRGATVAELVRAAQSGDGRIRFCFLQEIPLLTLIKC